MRRRTNVRHHSPISKRSFNRSELFVAIAALFLKERTKAQR
jgi:hypothetical protein